MMEKSNQLSDRIKITDPTIHKRPKKMMVKFDDPPGSSPARMILPILHGQESVREQLSDDLKGTIQKTGVGGVYSGAYTDETYAILIFALGGIAGGALGAVGQDICNIIKNTCKKIFQRKGAKRNVLEIALHFKAVDVILHYENRSALSLPESLNTADSILTELGRVLQDKRSILHQAKTIELRQIADEQKFECVLHSYRKAKANLNELTKHPVDKKEKKK